MQRVKEREKNDIHSILMVIKHEGNNTLPLDGSFQK